MRCTYATVAVMVVVAAVGLVAGQDAYTQGVVQGATLALAGTAVVGLGAIAIKQHQNRNRYRYRGHPGYYGNYYNQGYYGYGGYDQGYGGYNQFYRRRRAADHEEGHEEKELPAPPREDVLEGDFAHVMGQDENECAMRVVCELEARVANGEEVSEFGKIILSLFGPQPVPVPTSALGTARGRYSYAAYVGAHSDVKACGALYRNCSFSSDEILQHIKDSQKAAVVDAAAKVEKEAADAPEKQ